ncbi:MAG: hypothetical protein R3Y43_01225 [Alphaproteobacteria bacterium]
MGINENEVFTPIVDLVNKKITEQEFYQALTSPDSLNDNDLCYILSSIVEKKISKSIFTTTATGIQNFSIFIDELVLEMTALGHFEEEDLKEYMGPHDTIHQGFNNKFVQYVTLNLLSKDIYKFFLSKVTELEDVLDENSEQSIFLSPDETLREIYREFYPEEECKDFE